MNEWVGAGRRTDWGVSQGMLAIQLVAIYMGRGHMGFWQSRWWLDRVSQSVSQSVSKSVSESISQE